MQNFVENLDCVAWNVKFLFVQRLMMTGLLGCYSLISIFGKLIVLKGVS